MVFQTTMWYLKHLGALGVTNIIYAQGNGENQQGYFLEHYVA